MGDLIIACRSFARPTSSHQLEDPSDWNQTHFRSTRSDEPSNEKCSHSSEAKKPRRRLSLGTLSCDSSVAALKKKLRNGDGTFARDQVRRLLPEPPDSRLPLPLSQISVRSLQTLAMRGSDEMLRVGGIHFIFGKVDGDDHHRCVSDHDSREAGEGPYCARDRSLPTQRRQVAILVKGGPLRAT